MQPHIKRLFLGKLDQLGLHIAQLFRHHRPFQLDPRSGLVDNIDCLVRQEAVCHIPIGEFDRGNKRLVGDLHLVVCLIFLANALQNIDRRIDGRRFDMNRLEPALKRPILSTCLRYSSGVVAPMHCSSPRDNAGLSMLEASTDPSAAPAPIIV